MPIPDYQSFFVPVLRVASDGNEHSMADLRTRISTDLNLAPDDLNLRLPSGTQTVYANRVAWATFSLTKAVALERVSRGVFRIAGRRRELLALNLPRLTVHNLLQYPEFVAFHKGSTDKTTGGDSDKSDSPQTPEEKLANTYKDLRDGLANDLLETVLKASPAFFEELVIDLLVAMGYGGSVEDAGQAVGKSGDGGIDGIIKEDKLGLDVVYVQAKRWSNCVGRPLIQAFAGSLDGVRARKGVFITTSFFSDEALQYVRMIEKRIVLIDGKQLADLMIDHDIGVSVIQTYKIKRIDAAYFEDA